MSDLSIYKFEDNVWDEFDDENGDHIVPHPITATHGLCTVQGDSHKKPRHEVISVTSDPETKCNIQRKELSLPKLTRKDTMLEKGPWSSKSEGVFPASCNDDKVKEVTNMASNDTRMSDQGFKSGINSGSEFCPDDAIMDVGCSAIDNNIYHYPLSQISESDNGISFLNSDHGDGSNDLFYDGWADIGNFEDVDRMFRSCDSTFGLGNLPSEDELCWFSSPHVNQGSDDTMKSGPNGSVSESSGLKSVSESHEAFRPINTGPSVSNPNEKDSNMSKSTISQNAEADSVYSKEANMHKRQPKLENQSEGRREDRYLENGEVFHRYDAGQFADVKHPSRQPTFHEFSSADYPPPQNHVQHHLSYLQSDNPQMHLNFSHPQDQFPVFSALRSGQSENSGVPSPPANESSYASNHVFSVDSAQAPSLGFTAMPSNGKKEKIYQHPGLQASSNKNNKQVNVAGIATFYGEGCNQKQVQQAVNEVEGHSATDGKITGVHAELESASAAMDEISVEANSFRQLQQVMDKLDIQTKLCIRDSLYRLARSAEKRHGCANLNTGVKHDREAEVASLPEETDKCAGFMDVETTTNPIDRSIAHLLFHRPTDASVVSGNDAVSLKSPAMKQIGAAITSPRLMTEKKVCQEETSGGADQKILPDMK